MDEYTVYTKKTTQLREAQVIGHITAKAERLSELFRAPLEGDGTNSDAEWQVVLPNMHIVSIYNYRNGVAYMGEREGQQVINITDWTVKGFYEDDVQVLNELVNGKPGFVFEARLVSKSKDDIVKRLRAICNHIEEGKVQSGTISDYHSWDLREAGDLASYPQSDLHL